MSAIAARRPRAVPADSAGAAASSARSAEGRPLQARAVRTREAIITAAAQVFQRSGYAAASLDEIAQAADVTKGALYFHFPSKAALAAAILREHHAAWERTAAAAPTWNLNALDTLERMLRETTRSYQTSVVAQAGVRLGNEQSQIDTDIELPVPFVGWIERVTRLLQAGQQDGSVVTSLNTAAAARVLVASFFGIQEVSARLTGRADLRKRIDEWWRLIRPVLSG